jgi:two-component system, OmpR family, sensor kinase
LERRLGEAWEQISLRAKLTTLSVALIGVLVLVSSFGTIALLKTYLQANVDTMLTSTASTLDHEDPALLEDRLATRQVQLPRLPNDYYIAYLDTKGNLMIGLVSSTRSTQDVPNLTGFSSPYVLATHGLPFESATKSAGGSKSWRIVAVPLVGMPGSLVVAIPNTSNDLLLDQYRAIGTGFGILLLTLSGLAIWITISQALRPLSEVERTAAAVAAGDTSQRLIERPGKTEIARINSSLNTMLNSIESALQSRNKTLDQMRQFVADASHELRTPLVSVRGYAELYRLGALKKPADVAEAMERIEAEAIRMGDLVENLLTLARMDDDRKLEKQPVELFDLTSVAAKDASVADGNREIQIINLDGKTLAKGTSIVVPGDASQLRQVLTNLLANACRFSPDGAAVEVALGQRDGQTIIEVRDHGEGIPEQLRTKVFERFFRADNSRNRETGGSGLGLAIVDTIVKLHGGTIVADETAGGGATFRVTLPNA